MFFVYILESEKSGKFYIGQTADLDSRIRRHNAGRVKSTKVDRPWRLIYSKGYANRSDAYKVEQYLKSLKSRNAIIKFIKRGIAQSG